METETNNAARSWFELVKDKFETVTQQFELSWIKTTHYALALGGGILVGFVVRRYGRQAIITSFFFVALFMLFHHFGFITIDWERVKDIVGLLPTDTLDVLMQNYMQWAKDNMIALIIAFVGFVVGYKIG